MENKNLEKDIEAGKKMRDIAAESAETVCEAVADAFANILNGEKPDKETKKNRAIDVVEKLGIDE